MQPPAPLISAIICTRNRADLIASAVGSVLANDDDNFELIVIDQSDTEKSREALASLLEDPRLVYVHTTKVGLSAAYNAGTRRSRGTLLAFTDDDCIAPPDWLAAARAEFEMDPTADLIYGEVTMPRELADVPGVVPTLTFPARRRISSADGFVVAGMGANFALRRAAFDRIGGFDEALGGGGPLRSSQDFDFQYRLFRAAGASVLSPALKVMHYGHRTPRQWADTEVAYGVGDGAFYMKHLRCGDLLAGRLLTKVIARELGRITLGPLLRKRRYRSAYLRGVLRGSRDSFRFPVDRRHRMYVAE